MKTSEGSETATQPMIHAGIVVTTIAVFVADLLTRLGIATWIFYILGLGTRETLRCSGHEDAFTAISREAGIYRKQA